MPFTSGPIRELSRRACKEQARLAADVDRLIAEHAAAADQLPKGMPTLDVAGFHRTRLSVEAAHARMTEAMNALKKHREEHGC
jgi:hypothetical protein